MKRYRGPGTFPHDGRYELMTKPDYDILVGRVAAGEEVAFRSLYLGLHPRLIVAARQVGDNPSVAEEVVQDIFLWVWNNRGRLGKIDNIEQYLYRSTYRNMKQALRRERARQRRQAATLDDNAATNSPGAAAALIQREAADEQKRAVARVLSLLSPRQRQIIHLRFMEQKSYREISTLLAISEQVSRNMAYRGLKKLRGSIKSPGLFPQAFLTIGWSLLLLGTLVCH